MVSSEGQNLKAGVIWG